MSEFIVKIFPYYEATEELDKMEGRGGSKILIATRNKAIAQEIARGKGAWGQDGIIYEAWAMESEGKLYHLGPNPFARELTSLKTEEEEREISNALEKLSDREKKLLGLI